MAERIHGLRYWIACLLVGYDIESKRTYHHLNGYHLGAFITRNKVREYLKDRIGKMPKRMTKEKAVLMTVLRDVNNMPIQGEDS